MSSSEQEGTGLHITKQSRKGARGISSDLIPLAAGARAGTTPIRWVRAPPGRRASRVQLIGVATAETLYDRQCNVSPRPCGEIIKSFGEERFLCRNLK